VFELYDEAQNFVADARTMPSPERASEPLRAHAIPAEEDDRVPAGLRSSF
jgi:hypothetical protein